MHQKIKSIFSLLAISSFIALVSCQNMEVPDMHQTWKGFGGGADMSKYVVQNQITKANVGQLEKAWSYSPADGRSYRMNPVIVDTVMYVLAKQNSIVALNAKTGEEIWIHAALNGISRRGFAYWENEDRTQRRLLFTLNNSLQAVDAITGQSILDFGVDGAVDLRQGLGRDPNKVRRIASHTPGRVIGDLIILGSSPGESYMSSPGFLRAYSVITGEKVWTFHTIPQPGEFGYDTWPEEAYKYAGGVNCWGEISADLDRGIIYVPLGSPTYDYYGADRIGSNLFANCLLALNAKTGERIWHFQTVHHDLWDYDLTSAPQLTTVEHDGKKIDAVSIATKQGFLFAFDRVTGEPLWPIEEREVPKSSMPGEESWPTQPFPTVLEPFNRQTVTADDISPIFLSEEELAEWQERVRKAKKGLYTPPDTVETIAMPGAVGGANWGNTATNPHTGMVYVITQDYPSFYKLNARVGPLSARYRAIIASRQALATGKTNFEEHCSACHGKDLAGTSLAPTLLGLGGSLTSGELSQTIQYGTGRMPPVQHIGEEEIANIFAYVKNQSGSAERVERQREEITGPVVAFGGAPGEKKLISTGNYVRGGGDYPDGVEVPEQRYYTGYGLGRAYILKAPWSIITAYDLNTGAIKWQRPLGQDPHALAKGFDNTGVPTGTQRNGMIVTSNGIIFATVTSGQIYAYDAETGEILWEGQTDLAIYSIPSMYEIDGRVYLVVNATTPQITGWNQTDEEKRAGTQAKGNAVYQVYALPVIE